MSSEASPTGTVGRHGPPVEIGVIGGSGLYEFLDRHETVTVDTPFGSHSEPIVVGEVADRRVAFIARHGARHHLQPHRLNYRANLWALRSLGARQILSACAVGSLVAELGPGTVVVPDQVIDRTWGRAHTIYGVEGPVVHVGFADPYCTRGRDAAIAAGGVTSLRVVPEGTLVVINGPRFSSRAESRMHRQLGGSIVGMTTMPEAAIARELAMCFTTVAMVTDLDAGVDGGDPVTHDEVLRAFAANVEHLKELLRAAIVRLPAAEPDESATCPCRRSLDGIALPFLLP